MTILPIAYLPSVEYLWHLSREECTIDLGEHFIKRSERNRTRILAPDGPLELTANVQHANRPKQPVRDIRLDYSKRWQHQHWGALIASYNASPYFIHYAELFEPLYRKPYRFLADLNLEILERLCPLLHVPLPRISEQYVEADSRDLDLRPKQKKGPAFIAEPYVQVFSDRLPFEANLSAIDLLFAEGPASASVLKACRAEP